MWEDNNIVIRNVHTVCPKSANAVITVINVLLGQNL